jgi:hypothetical protein
MPPLEAQFSSQTPPFTINGVAMTNGQLHDGHGSSEGDKVSKTRADSYKPLKIPLELPPEFHPSGPSSRPRSGDSSTMRHPHYNPYAPSVQNKDFHGYAPQMPPRPSQPVTFNPEANFRPLDSRGIQLSRTSSHTSSADRPINGFDLQSPGIPRTPATFNDPKMASAFNLQDYVLGQFNHSELSDTTVDISALTDGAEQRQIRAHSLILFRSPILQRMMNDLEQPDRTIRIQPPNRFTTEFGFVGALRYLYGAPLLTPSDFIHEISQANFLDISPNAPAGRTMSQILSYVASGYFLDLPAVVGAGLECTGYLQRWDTVPTCLAFALDGGLTHWWRTYAGPKKQSDTSARVEQQEPTFGEVGSQLLQETLIYIAAAFPDNFHFDSTATQLHELPRLPTIIENRPSTSDPRLSLIQFGEMAIEDTGRPDFLTTFISSILLSLPFAALKFLSEHPMFNLKANNRLHIVQAVIQERELRRLKVLSAKRLKGGKDPSLWEATKWSEKVTEVARVFPGFQLHRTRVDGDTSAGA